MTNADGHGSGVGRLGIVPRVRRMSGGTSGPAGRSVLITVVIAIVAYAVIRAFIPPGAAIVAWTAAASLLAFVSLPAGVMVLAAIAPFGEAVDASGAVGPAPVLLVAVGASVLLRAVPAWRRLAREPLVLLAAAFFAATAASIVVTVVRFGSAPAAEAARFWAVGPAAVVVAAVAAAHVAASGDRRPLFVALGSLVVAAFVSVTTFLAPGALEATPLGFLLRPDRFGVRLSGVLPAPNAAATLFVAPAAFLSALALFAAAPARARLTAGLAAAASLAATVLTLSRSAAVAVMAIVAVFATRFGRRTAMVLGVLAPFVAITVVAAYLALRWDRAGTSLPFTIAGDTYRFDGWAAAFRMWLDAPIAGHGAHSFERLHRAYGAAAVDAPHNEWLRFFAEGGLLAAGSALALLAVAARRLFGRRDWVATGGLGALVGLAITASFNNPLTYIQVTVPVLLLVGSAIGDGRADVRAVRAGARSEADAPTPSSGTGPRSEPATAPG